MQKNSFQMAYLEALSTNILPDPPIPKPTKIRCPNIQRSTKYKFSPSGDVVHKTITKPDKISSLNQLPCRKTEIVKLKSFVTKNKDLIKNSVQTLPSKNNKAKPILINTIIGKVVDKSMLQSVVVTSQQTVGNGTDRSTDGTQRHYNTRNLGHRTTDYRKPKKIIYPILAEERILPEKKIKKNIPAQKKNIRTYPSSGTSDILSNNVKEDGIYQFEGLVRNSSHLKHTKYNRTNNSKSYIDLPSSEEIDSSPIETIQHQNPMSYIGISLSNIHIIDLIQKFTTLKRDNILMCLRKLRLNTQFMDFADQFKISERRASNIFSIGISHMAKVFSKFVNGIDTEINRVERTNNNKYIIDFIELKIEKLSNPIEQASTFSKRMGTNTLKYLILCNEHGIITYISLGYFGRTSDFSIIEDSKIYSKVGKGSVILPNIHIEGISYSEHLLLDNNVKILSFDNSNMDDIVHKSLITNMNTVKERINNFHILDNVGRKLLKDIDDVISIICGIVNLNGSLDG